MKRTLLISLILISSIPLAAQVRLAGWTFDGLLAAPNTLTTISPLANGDPQASTAFLYANGTNGSSTWVTATTGNEYTQFAGNVLNDPRGVPSAGQALALLNTSANGKSIVIKFSMTGYKNPILTYATQRTATGFTTQTWSWSTDGSTFTTIGANIPSAPSTFLLQSQDMSSINAIDGAATVYLQLTVTGATSASGNNRLDNIVITASTATAPNFTATYPKVQTVSATGFEGIVNLDKTGTGYLVVLPNGATAPSSAQVKAGQDANGTGQAANFIGQVTVSSAATEFTIPISGLTASTDYDVYFVADNVDGIMASPVMVDVTTLSASDITPPVFTSSYPSISPITATGFTVRTNLDEAGKTYFVVLPFGATTPTAAQVKAGQDASGSAVAANLAGSINVLASGTEYTFDVTGLSPKTLYDIYFIAEDNVPNLQTSPVLSSTSTEDLYIEDFNACESTASFTQYSVTGDQVWGCTDFGRGPGSKGIRMNGFAVTAIVNEDWLISPRTNLSGTPELSFYSQFSFAGNSLQLKISTDYTGSGDPTTATWTNLNGNFPAVAVSSSSSSLADWTFSNVDLSAYTGQSVFIAFVYTSTAVSAARWTLDDVNVSGGKATYFTSSQSAISFNTSPATASYTLTGHNITSTVTVQTASSDFQVSRDNSSFSSSATFTDAEANAGATVYVKFIGTPNAGQTTTATITNSSLNASPLTIQLSGRDLSKSLNITTWNLEFFGTDVHDTGGTEFGPTNDALQVTNATTVMQTIASDIFAVEEVSDDAAFNQLVSNLSGYDKILSNRWSYSFDPPDPNFPPQKVGFIFKTSTVSLVNSRPMFAKLYDDIQAGSVTLPNYPGGTSSSFWSSGRLPFMITFDVTVQGIQKRIRLIDIHAKSGSAAADYNRRKYDVQVLFDTLAANYPNDNIVLLGDYNDDVDNSIFIGNPSSYKVFVDDNTNYNTLTAALSQTSAYSFPSSSSFIDHIIISNELNASYVANSIQVEDPRNYISNYVNTTSDHLPVTSRFALVKSAQTITFSSLASKTFGDAPFNLTATSDSGLPVSYVSSDVNIATISGNTLTITGGGTVTITAKQAGNSGYNSATDVPQDLVVNKANQTITFNALADKTLGDAAFGLTGTASSTLTVDFSTTSDKITIVGTQVTIVKSGRASIAANQAGNANYNSATAVNQSFCINPAKPTISVNSTNPASPVLTSNATAGNQWFLNGNAIAGATGVTYTATAAGTYKVQSTTDDCVSAFSNDAVVVITGDIIDWSNTVTLSPNPAEKVIKVYGLAEVKGSQVTDANGRSIPFQLEKMGEYHQGDVEHFAAGLYLLRIQTESKVVLLKFVKR